MAIRRIQIEGRVEDVERKAHGEVRAYLGAGRDGASRVVLPLALARALEADIGAVVRVSIEVERVSARE